MGKRFHDRHVTMSKTHWMRGVLFSAENLTVSHVKGLYRLSNRGVPEFAKQ